MNSDTLLTVGAGYAAVQAIAQFLMIVLPKHTIAWKVAKFVVSGPQRPPSENP